MAKTLTAITYIVSRDTIDLLASAIRAWKVDVYTEGGQRLSGITDNDVMAGLLYAENVKSFNYRYDDAEPANDYTLRPLCLDRAAAAIQPEVLVLGSIRCLRYQSCEHPEYAKSLAAKILDALEAEAIRRLTADAPWGYTRYWTKQRRAETKAKIAKQMQGAR